MLPMVLVLLPTVYVPGIVNSGSISIVTLTLAGTLFALCMGELRSPRS
jgi:hypothetical protein